MEGDGEKSNVRRSEAIEVEKLPKMKAPETDTVKDADAHDGCGEGKEPREQTGGSGDVEKSRWTFGIQVFTIMA